MSDPFSAWLGDEPAIPRKSVEVGWLLNTNKAKFVWDAPRRVGRDATPPGPQHGKSLVNCPAVLDHDARLFEVPCPFDLRLGFRAEGNGNMVLVDLDGDNSAVRNKVLGEHVVLTDPAEWRHPERPVLQITTPYLFIADEPVQMIQSPPYNYFNPNPWPGLLVSGRVPIHIWPRQLMWAFEWWDVKSPLVFKRGTPWFYARFDGMDPSRPIRMVEAVMTPDLSDYLEGLSSVTGYISRTYSLFKTAQERRPAALLTRKGK